MSVYIRKIEKKYAGGFHLKIEDFPLIDGKVNCIIGPSGGGKSTLLKALSGLDGDAEMDMDLYGSRKNSPKDFSRSERQSISFVSQRPALLRRSVRENIRYPLDLSGMDRRASDALVEEIAKKTGLSDKLVRNSYKLSGGEAQRMSLARALVTKPQLLVLDEPTANLDPKNVTILEELIRSANEEQGITVLLVTHNMFQAKRLAHNLALLIDGKMDAIGERDLFFSEAADEKIRRFISGEMVY